MLTALRRLWGHDSIGPSCVSAQFITRIRSPISPPPTNQSWVGEDGFFVGRFLARRLVIFWMVLKVRQVIYPRTDDF
jgi:hypothetical protein